VLRAICLMMLILPSAGLSAAENTTVTQMIEGRQLTFGGSLKTKFEGLAVALLGSCHTETTLVAGKKELWVEALKGDHILVAFAKPRVFMVNDQQDSGKESELHASQILVPIGPYSSPKQIYVRSGDRYRTFSKYEFQISEAFQKQLQNMLPLPKPPTPK
jgi:hypothetical protein